MHLLTWYVHESHIRGYKKAIGYTDVESSRRFAFKLTHGGFQVQYRYIHTVPSPRARGNT